MISIDDILIVIVKTIQIAKSISKTITYTCIYYTATAICKKNIKNDH